MRISEILILVLCLMRISEQMVSFHEESFDGEVLSCVNRIAELHFNMKYETTILGKRSEEYVKELRMKLIRLIADQSELENETWLPETIQVLVFLGEDIHRDLEVMNSLKIFHPRSRLLIVCKVEDNGGSSVKSYLMKLIQYLKEHQRQNVAVIVGPIKREVRVYGYTSTSYGNCGSPVILDFGKCNSKAKLAKIFPMNHNYNRCPLVLATCDWPPMTEFYVENGIRKSIGIESNIVNLILERLNASSYFIDAQPSEIRKLVENRTADIGWGQLSTYQSNGYTYTHGYTFVYASVLVPNYLSDTKMALNNFLPLKQTVWICLVLVVVINLILRIPSSVFKKIPLLNILGLCLGLGVTTRPQRSSQRVYIISWAIFGYILTQAYLANLTMIFTKSNDKNLINSLDELEKSSIPFGGSILTRKTFYKKYPRIYKEYIVMNLTDFKNNLIKLKTGRGGVATYVEVSKYVDYSQWKHMTLLPEVLSSYPVAMIVPNVSNIKPICDWVSAAALEAGLLNHWAYSINYRRWKADNSTEKFNGDNRRMDLQQVLTMFRSLLIVMSFNCFVFIIELLVGFWQGKETTERKKPKITWSKKKSVTKI